VRLAVTWRAPRRHSGPRRRAAEERDVEVEAGYRIGRSARPDSRRYGRPPLASSAAFPGSRSRPWLVRLHPSRAPSNGARPPPGPSLKSPLRRGMRP
jgi:hypothetical protein